MLDLAILGLLSDVPRHGYELKQQLAELGFWKVSFGSLYPALRRLEKRGLILLTRREFQMMKSSIPKKRQQRIDLTGIQKETVEVIGKHVREGSFRRIILHGPPASGKMEVFLRVMEEALPPSSQALILVPELSLTPPLITRLEEIYPGERVVVFHSRLSARQRQRNWILCRRGEARVVIGSRSAKKDGG